MVRSRLVFAAITVFLASLTVLGLVWAFLIVPEAEMSDAEWRGAQPFAGEPFPDDPTLADLYAVRTFGPDPVNFTVALPPGSYGIAASEEAPIGGARIDWFSSSGNQSGGIVWFGGNADTYAEFTVIYDLEGGPVRFEFTGKGRILLMNATVSHSLLDRVELVRFIERMAIALPDSLAHGWASEPERLVLQFESDVPIRISAYDDELHEVGKGEGTSGGVEVRSDASFGVFVVLESHEGAARVTLRISKAPPFPVRLVALVGNSALLIATAVVGWAWRSSTRLVDSPPQVKDPSAPRSHPRERRKRR